MEALQGFVRGIDALNDWIGRTVAWLALGCVVTCFAVVVLRYAFNIGFPWLQEMYVWQHAAVFMAGAGYTMLHRGHVNVDVLYGQLNDRRKAWIDILGTLIFLLPTCAILAWLSWPFFMQSFNVFEGSSNAGGLLRWPIKLVLPVGFVLVALQGLSELIKRVAFLNGIPVESLEAHYERPTQ